MAGSGLGFCHQKPSNDSKHSKAGPVFPRGTVSEQPAGRVIGSEVDGAGPAMRRSVECVLRQRDEVEVKTSSGNPIRIP